MVGGDDEDVLVGDSFAAGLAKGKGSDRNILGARGNDEVFGDDHPKSGRRRGGGKDFVRGGKGKDRLEGGPGKDHCQGGPKRDRFKRKGPQRCESTAGDP